jgi:hypothetical protein
MVLLSGRSEPRIEREASGNLRVAVISNGRGFVAYCARWAAGGIIYMTERTEQRKKQDTDQRFLQIHAPDPCHSV